MARNPGEGTLCKSGYWKFSVNGRQVPGAVLKAEQALGKRLPPGVEVHHVDENPSNDSSSNLVVCPDKAYHKLLHRRTRAYNATGHADWLYCRICKTYGPPAELRSYGNPKDPMTVHPACNALKSKAARAKRA